jgi:HEAT repeat protein
MSNPPAVQRRIRRHIENLGHSDQELAAHAEAYLIRYYGVRALDDLIEATRSDNAMTRFRAAWVLGYTHDPRAFESLVSLVEDPDSVVRYETTIALGILGDPRVVPVLTELARRNHEDWPAFYAFSKWGRPAIPVMEELLRESDPALRHGALNVLGGFAQEYADAHCVQLVRSCLQDPEPSIRSDAHYWLEELGLVPAGA